MSAPASLATSFTNAALPHRAFGGASGVLVLVLGLVVLVGWHMQLAWLIQVIPRSAPMQYNTALSLVLVGGALLALNRDRPRLSGAVGGAVALLALLTLIQYLLTVDIGIDELFMRHYITVETSHPGRMAPNTAVSFLLLGLANQILISRIPTRARLSITQSLALLTVTLAATALIGYVLDVEGVYGWSTWTQMAPHTSIGLLIAGLGMLSEASVRSRFKNSKASLWRPALLYIGVFALDIFTPLGVTMGILYLPLVFSSLWFIRPYAAIISAVVATVLIIIGYLGSPFGAQDTQHALFNRVLSAGGVWVTALVVYLYMRSVERLRIKADQLRLALEGGAVGLWDWNVQTGRVEYSPEWAEMLGYSLDELSPNFSTWERLVHPEDRPRAQRRIKSYLNDGSEGYRIEFRMRHKNDHWRWIRAHGKIVEADVHGHPLRLAGSHVDISLEKETENRLRLLQSAVDHSESVVLVTTPDSADPRIIYASRTAEKLTGYSSDELLGLTPSLFQANNRDQPELEGLRAALAKGEAFKGELTNYRKDGAEYRIRLHIFPIRDSDGQLLYFGSLTDDITEEHRLAQELHHERERFWSVVEFSPIGIALVSPIGEWLHVNKAVCDIVGYTEEELLASDFQTITHPDDLDLDLNYLQQVLDGTIDSYEMEKRYFHKTGRIVWILLTVSLVRGPDGTPRHFISQIQDISKRKQQEEEIKQYNAELERSNQELDDFAYIASHDLKEPLRAINNHSQSLLKRYAEQLDEKAVHKLNRLVALTARMEKLISDLLFFSRLGRGISGPSRVDVGEVVNEQIELLSAFLQERNADIEIKGSLPVLHGSASGLAIVFRNLISNAVKYNESDERKVAISFDKSFEREGETLTNVFHVSDNGIGIEPHFFIDVFRMFKRLHGEKVYGEGTGAGLTFVKKIVEQHGGEIWLSSEIGVGTTFHFSVPGEPYGKA